MALRFLFQLKSMFAQKLSFTPSLYTKALKAQKLKRKPEIWIILRQQNNTVRIRIPGMPDNGKLLVQFSDALNDLNTVTI